jgi:hypothetical protein
LLGRKDEPTDAIEEYCRYLGSALQAYNFQFDIRGVPWELYGWSDALHALNLQAERWGGTSVLVQYTALAWSLRGFPWRILGVLKVLKSAGVRLGIVFHDLEPYRGSRPIDSLLRESAKHAMHRLFVTGQAAG